MVKVLIPLFFLFFNSLTYAQRKHVQFDTPYGTFKVLLYDFTPKHRDLFVESIQDEVYKDALFNRVIKDFVVQGGEHDIAIEKREKENPTAGKPRLAPEFDSRAFHKLGALGAGRDDNPEKASFLNQIYFVVGKAVTEKDLDDLTQKKHIQFTAEQRASYLRDGGLPRLDQDYTVFGEVYEGFDVLLNISKVATDKANYPIQAIPFHVNVFDHAQ